MMLLVSVYFDIVNVTPPPALLSMSLPSRVIGQPLEVTPPAVVLRIELRRAMSVAPGEHATPYPAVGSLASPISSPSRMTVPVPPIETQGAMLLPLEICARVVPIVI